MGFGLGGVGGSCCGGIFTSTGVILVLFILLVIVSRSFI
ncbi:YjcZ family sporulation protein [Paenibacillus sp. UNC451MF]|nr:YjcZ family sporulation protein [Paenibacillus sp. UNC451MF]